MKPVARAVEMPANKPGEIGVRTTAVRNRYRVQRGGFALLAFCSLVVVIPIFLVIGTIVARGIGAINWEFLTAMPRDGMKAGGILPAIVGTLVLTLGTAIVAIPIGVAGAIYLSEYARDTWLTRAIRLAIVNLAGIPSVVYGLFGLGIFVLFLRFGTSILAGSLTLAIMTLPIIISTAEEALRAVPTEFRTVSASLGGTALAGGAHRRVATGLARHHYGSHPGLLRAGGETAPILFTVAAFYLPRLPHSPLDQPWRCPTICTSSAPRFRACRRRSSLVRPLSCWRWCSR